MPPISIQENHSTETALIHVQDSILRSMDRSECTFLVLLDLSAAFDTVDHGTICSRLSEVFGISGSALRWFSSYLQNRKQSVCVRDTHSTEAILGYGVPQGSVLGPELFKDYTSVLAQIIEPHGVNHHFYADDTQLFILFKPGVDEASALLKLQQCVDSVRRWMSSNFLKLNDDKSEFVIIGSQHNIAG